MEKILDNSISGVSVAREDQNNHEEDITKALKVIHNLY